MKIGKKNSYMIWDALNDNMVSATASGRILLKLPPHGVSVLVIRRSKPKKEIQDERKVFGSK